MPMAPTITRSHHLVISPRPGLSECRDIRPTPRQLTKCCIQRHRTSRRGIRARVSRAATNRHLIRPERDFRRPLLVVLASREVGCRRAARWLGPRPALGASPRADTPGEIRGKL